MLRTSLGKTASIKCGIESVLLCQCLRIKNNKITHQRLHEAGIWQRAHAEAKASAKTKRCCCTENITQIFEQWRGKTIRWIVLYHFVNSKFLVVEEFLMPQASCGCCFSYVVMWGAFTHVPQPRTSVDTRQRCTWEHRCPHVTDPLVGR